MALVENKFLTSAVLRLLRPLVRLLLKNNIAYKSFSDLAKWVYVDIASNEFPVPEKKQTISRVAILTGLSRKEVSRVQQLSGPSDEHAAVKYNRAARVINGWVSDKQFHDEQGEPAILSMDEFHELVKKYSGDLPTKAMLYELDRIGAVTSGENNVTLLAHAFVPSESDDDKYYILGIDTSLLLNTLSHNIMNKDDAYFQRKVMYDNLPEGCLNEFRKMSAEKSQALLEEFNDYLSRYDRDLNPGITVDRQMCAGVGIYYFEDEVSNTASEEKKND